MSPEQLAAIRERAEKGTASTSMPEAMVFGNQAMRYDIPALLAYVEELERVRADAIEEITAEHSHGHCSCSWCEMAGISPLCKP